MATPSKMAASLLQINGGNDLLKLPTELRLQIYGYVLHAPDGVACQLLRMHGVSSLYCYTRYRMPTH